jgi:hypothetical protein
LKPPHPRFRFARADFGSLRERPTLKPDWLQAILQAVSTLFAGSPNLVGERPETEEAPLSGNSAQYPSTLNG